MTTAETVLAPRDTGPVGRRRCRRPPRTGASSTAAGSSPRSFVLFALFVIWPLLRGIYLSFTDANISGEGESFVGLDNYREALNDPLMWDALGHSVYFTLLVVPCITVLAFLLAMLAHHIERGKMALAAVLLRPVPAALHRRGQPCGSGCSTPARE